MRYHLLAVWTWIGAHPVATALLLVALALTAAIAADTRRRRRRELALVHLAGIEEAARAVSAVVSANSRDRIAENTLALLAPTLSVARLALFIPSRAGDELVPLTHHGIAPAEAEAATVEIGSRSALATAARERRLVVHGGPEAPPLGLNVAAPIVVKGEVFGVLGFTSPDFEAWPARKRDLLQELLGVASASLAKLSRFEAASVESDEHRRRVGLLQSYVSPTIARQLMENPDVLTFEGDVCEVTVIFADILGFTTFCETTEPRLVLRRLNEFLSSMTEVILSCDGTLDKYVGDQIMAYWNAPLSQSDHAWLAVQAALGMRRRLRELRAAALADGREPFRMGIALNTGRVVFGHIGSVQKKDITIIGDTVNLCARYEKLTREYGADIILGSQTYLLVKTRVQAEPLGKVQVRGREEEEMVYQLIGPREPEPNPETPA